MEIIVHPDERLRIVSTPVEDIGALEATIHAAALTMLSTQNGVGLSGIQIGIPKRFFIMQGDHPGSIEAAINPEFKVPDGIEAVEIDEGCLSFPNTVVKYKRYPKILATYIGIDPFSKKQTEHKEQLLDGLKAHVFQHELDHLNGVLMIDALEDVIQKRITGRLKKWKMKGYRYP